MLDMGRTTSPLTFSDLTADLVWPNLLRAGHLALRPSRLGIAMVFIVGFMLLAALGDKLDNDKDGNALATSTRVVALDAVVAAAGREERAGERPARQLFDAMIATPAYVPTNHPWAAIIAVPLMALWTALAGGAICRSAACEFSQGVMLEWPKSVGFAMGRWRSLLLALVMPLLIVWGIALGLAIAGFVLFRFGGINLLGGLLWPVFLFGGVVAAIVMLAFVIGWPLLIPSVACEGTDAVDAVQHAYSFVFARPLRMVIYLAILIAQMVLLAGVIAIICWLGVLVAQRCGLAWSGWRGERVLSDLPGHPGTPMPSGETMSVRGSHWLVSLWTLIPAFGIPAAFIVSYIWSGSTVLYLAMRKLVDGQDVHEVWMPGMVEGTRAIAAAPAPVISAPIEAAKNEAISDTGPADAT